MFHLPDELVLQKLAPVYDSEGVMVTYKRFLGVDRTGDEPVELWDDRPCLALTGRRKKFSTSATGDVVAQVMDQTFIMRAPELLDANVDLGLVAIEFQQLTENDKILFNGLTQGVKNHRYISPFIRLEARGS